MEIEIESEKDKEIGNIIEKRIKGEANVHPRHR